MMSEQLTQSIDRGCFHFEVGNAMLSKSKLVQSVDQVRIFYAQTEYPSLRTIKARTGNSDAVVKIWNEMLEQRSAATAHIRHGGSAMELRMSNERMQQLL